MALIELSIILWFIFFGFSIILGIILIKMALNSNYTRIQREYYLGIAIFDLLHLIARIFYYYFDFILIGDENLWMYGAITAFVGLAFILYAIERNIFPQSKFILTILTAIAAILLIILPSDIGSVLQIIALPILAPTIPLIYFYIAYKSTEEVRRISLINGFGIFIFLAGQVAHSRYFFEMGSQWLPIYFIAAPTLLLIGGIIFIYGLTRKT